jgi:hypothetical protein
MRLTVKLSRSHAERLAFEKILAARALIPIVEVYMIPQLFQARLSRRRVVTSALRLHLVVSMLGIGFAVFRSCSFFLDADIIISRKRLCQFLVGKDTL